MNSLSSNPEVKSEVGMKNDTGKLQIHLYPFAALRATVRVLMFGAKKYAPGNWRKVDDRRDRYFDAAMRHLIDWYAGEKYDPETGESHLAHVACCVAFLLAEEEEKK